jgi:hypothetical protein
MFDWLCVLRESGPSSTVASEQTMRSLAVHPGLAARTACQSDGWCSHLATPTTRRTRRKKIHCAQLDPLCNTCTRIQNTVSLGFRQLSHTLSLLYCTVLTRNHEYDFKNPFRRIMPRELPECVDASCWLKVKLVHIIHPSH